MLISVDFWKSMHGFAMDSRTRESFHSNYADWNVEYYWQFY